MKRSYRLDQPENADQKKKMNASMKIRSRRKRVSYIGLFIIRVLCMQLVNIYNSIIIIQYIIGLLFYVLQLMKTRSECLETDEERAVWMRATVELMSEEEDGAVDGRAVWIVSPPSKRDAELSALCQVLQKRKEKRDTRSFHRVQRETLR